MVVEESTAEVSASVQFVVLGSPEVVEVEVPSGTANIEWPDSEGSEKQSMSPESSAALLYKVISQAKNLDLLRDYKEED